MLLSCPSSLPNLKTRPHPRLQRKRSSTVSTCAVADDRGNLFRMPLRLHEQSKPINPTTTTTTITAQDTMPLRTPSHGAGTATTVRAHAPNSGPHSAATTTTQACRAALLAAVAAALLWHDAADAAVQRAWDAMRASPFVQWDTFEPTLVVLTFMASMAGFWLLDVPLKHHTARWRLSADEDMGAWRWSNVADRLRGETLTYILPLAAFDLLLPRRHLPELAPTFGVLCTEVLLALALYDILFTFGHIACHRLPWLYRVAHRKHHTLAVVRAIETVRLTPGEEALDVVCSIGALNLLGCHPLSRAVYDVLIVYLLTELHSGYSMPWMLQDVVPFGWWAGSRRHADHHRYGNVYYQKFFSYLDNALGYVREPSSSSSGSSSSSTNDSSTTTSMSSGSSSGGGGAITTTATTSLRHEL